MGNSVELFCLTDADTQDRILYAPLHGFALRADQDLVDLVVEWLDGASVELPGPVAEMFEDRNLRVEQRWPPAGDLEAPQRPTTVTVFPTSGCNLRCVYCYAEGGSSTAIIDAQIARAAVHYVFEGARESGATRVSLAFHGGGEPALAWREVTETTTYAERLSEEAGLGLDTGLATNGVLTKSQVDWLAAHMKSLTVSLDGPPDIQDQQRPHPDGTGSYEEVYATLKRLDEAGASYALRTTITPNNVQRMVEIVDHFSANFSAKTYQLEPLFECGRCRATGWHAPDAGAYIENFRLAYNRGRELGKRVTFSGARLEQLTSRFCGAAGSNFCVTPEGYVTCCYEVTSPDDPRAEMFVYGHYEPTSGRFSLDEGKLARLRRHQTHYLDWCADCFCRWHCAGDCPAKAMAAGLLGEGSPRCELVRALTKFQLLQILPRLQGQGDERVCVKTVFRRGRATD